MRKTMSHSTEEAEKMVEAWKKSGKQFTIGYQNRFREEVMNLRSPVTKENLVKSTIGKAHAVRRRAVPTWAYSWIKKHRAADLLSISEHMPLTLHYGV